MKTIVQKFGGSSLATAELRALAATRVLAARSRGIAPVVVCSALGRWPDPYATDALGALVGDAAGGPNRDLLLACGETIACAVFAEVLVARGADAQALTGGQAGIITDAHFGNATILRVEPATVRAALARGIIPVVAGFQGVTEDGTITTLGRGGSDLSAIALGAALKAEVVEVFTDVSGVMSGDPRRIPGAQPLERVHYAEMVELASDGAKVMHVKAAELARVTGTPYVVKGLQANFGTTIDESTPSSGETPVAGITSVAGVALFRVAGGRNALGHAPQLAAPIFRRLAERSVSVDMVNINDAGIFFVVDATCTGPVQAELDRLDVRWSVHANCAKLSIVGAGMRGAPGVVSRVVDVLADACVDILHTTDSNITISVLVAAHDEARAERTLHDAFALGREVRLRVEIGQGR
ncbi:MAG: aspartate kinase [Candidatus Eremiobacteraeota bacterium]|nr:aspartate kinase [Candidatus Eremiobacteraeota bacterium]MBC5803230.1 aspartate kinase [Candidatus Eremiobacteraeota bacterium]MBC5823038.1 aspartate kinase [Candidatus Eremiobacteraeota bacterium]